MNTMKLLADEFQGDVRFGYIDFHADELLREMLQVYNAPCNFLFWQGMVYETKPLRFGYVPVR
jgi:hypothetical protein